jgi:hypothetical protein
MAASTRIELAGRDDRPGRPVAVTLADAAELLRVDPARVEQAAAAVEPYRHHDGTPRWSLAGLAGALGLADQLGLTSDRERRRRRRRAG